MSFRLVTVASFHDPVAAALARNHLEDEGIPATLIDETTVATDWLYANAIGGIKLQVSPLHLERAEALLARVRDETDPAPADAIADEETAAELRSEHDDKAPINVMTDRLFRCSVFGLLFLPLQAYTLYLLWAIWKEPGKVSPHRRWKIWTSMALNVPIVACVGIPALWLLSQLGEGPGSPEHPVWQRRRFQAIDCSVKMPHEPEFRQGDALGRFGKVRMQSWTAWAGRCAFCVSIDQNVNFPAHQSAGQILQTVARDRLLGGQGIMVKESPVEYRGVAGREFWVRFADVEERGRIFLRGNDLVCVDVLGTAQEVASAEAERFLQSFRIQ